MLVHTMIVYIGMIGLFGGRILLWIPVFYILAWMLPESLQAYGLGCTLFILAPAIIVRWTLTINRTQRLSWAPSRDTLTRPPLAAERRSMGVLPHPPDAGRAAR